MRSRLEFAVGLLIWCGVLWDGFVTIILPRTVRPMRRLSGRFYRWSWRLWAAAGRRIRDPQSRLSFVAVYGPISIVLLLVLWAELIIVAFALIYHGLGPRFLAASGAVVFGTLLYTSASTFLTLGLGDVTSPGTIGRLFILLEAGTGYIFLALIITYMPVLDQAYGVREVGNVLIHSRVGHPPSAIKLLHRYSGTDRSAILRGDLREAERWMAEILQSHLSHPMLSFYRAQHWGQSWSVSLTTVLDVCALLIAGGDGLLAAQARVTYRMGIRLLKDLTEALNLTVDPRCRVRLSTAVARPARGREGIGSPFEPGAGCGDSTPPARSSLRRVSCGSLRIARDPLAFMDAVSGCTAGERWLGEVESSDSLTDPPHHSPKRTGPSGRRTGQQPPGESEP